MIYDPPLEILCKRNENTYSVRFLIVNWVRIWSYLLMLKYAIKAINIIIVIIIIIIIIINCWTNQLPYGTTAYHSKM